MNLELALSEAFADYNTRADVADALNDGDGYHAARLIVAALNRIPTSPERPALTPNGQAGLGAEVPIERRVALAGWTP